MQEFVEVENRRQTRGVVRYREHHGMRERALAKRILPWTEFLHRAAQNDNGRRIELFFQRCEEGCESGRVIRYGRVKQPQCPFRRIEIAFFSEQMPQPLQGESSNTVSGWHGAVLGGLLPDEQGFVVVAREIKSAVFAVFEMGKQRIRELR